MDLPVKSMSLKIEERGSNCLKDVDAKPTRYSKVLASSASSAPATKKATARTARARAPGCGGGEATNLKCLNFPNDQCLLVLVRACSRSWQ